MGEAAPADRLGGRQHPHQLVGVHQPPSTELDDLLGVGGQGYEGFVVGHPQLGDHRRAIRARDLEHRSFELASCAHAHATVDRHLLQSEPLDRGGQPLDDGHDVIGRQLCGRPHVEQHPVPLEAAVGGEVALDSPDGVQRLHVHPLELRERNERARPVAHGCHVPHLGQHEEPDVAWVVVGGAAERVDVLHGRDDVEGEVLESPQLEAPPHHGVQDPVQGVFFVPVGASTEGDVMHAAHPRPPGRGREGDDHLAGLLRQGRVDDALELAREGVPVGRERGAPQVEVDEHLEAVFEVLDERRGCLGRPFEVVAIDVGAHHVGPDPVQGAGGQGDGVAPCGEGPQVVDGPDAVVPPGHHLEQVPAQGGARIGVPPRQDGLEWLRAVDERLDVPGAVRTARLLGQRSDVLRGLAIRLGPDLLHEASGRRSGSAPPGRGHGRRATVVVSRRRSGRGAIARPRRRGSSAAWSRRRSRRVTTAPTC